MKQDDIDALTRTANLMDEILRGIRNEIKDLDRVVDRSPVGDKGQPMSVPEINYLATVAARMRCEARGLTEQIEKIDHIVGRNLSDRNEGKRS